MMNIIKKLKNAGSNRTTYRVGLLQAKAYRVMKQHTDKKLIPYELSSTHWAFLGLLYDNPSGMRPGEIATELGVEAPFISRLIVEFTKKGFIGKKDDPKDSRSMFLCLTAKGNDQVAAIEKYLRAEISPLIEGIPLSEIITYLAVLNKIIENGKNK